MYKKIKDLGGSIFIKEYDLHNRINYFISGITVQQFTELHGSIKSINGNILTAENGEVFKVVEFPDEQHNLLLFMYANDIERNNIMYDPNRKAYVELENHKIRFKRNIRIEQLDSYHWCKVVNRNNISANDILTAYHSYSTKPLCSTSDLQNIMKYVDFDFVDMKLFSEVFADVLKFGSLQRFAEILNYHKRFKHILQDINILSDWNNTVRKIECSSSVIQRLYLLFYKTSDTILDQIFEKYGLSKLIPEIGIVRKLRKHRFLFDKMENEAIAAYLSDIENEEVTYRMLVVAERLVHGDNAKYDIALKRMEMLNIKEPIVTREMLKAVKVTNIEVMYNKAKVLQSRGELKRETWEQDLLM